MRPDGSPGRSSSAAAVCAKHGRSYFEFVELDCTDNAYSRSRRDSSDTFLGKTANVLAAALVITIAYTYAADTPLLEPHNLIVDRSLPREQADTQIIAARRLRQILSTRRCRPVALRELQDRQPRSRYASRSRTSAARSSR